MNRMPYASLPTLVEQRRRIEDIDTGGGEITREFYVEPYSAHSIVQLALIGTVDQDGEGATWRRIKPSSDPYFPHFYCTRAKCDQIDQRAIAQSDSTGFSKQNSQSDAVSALSTALAKPEDAIGTDTEQFPAGAFVTATYHPLIILSGISGNDDPFDYVDPQWRPMSKATLVGRELNILIDGGAGTEATPIDDTNAAIMEVIWEFSIRRIMVPSIPYTTINLLTNRVNKEDFLIGDLKFPKETLRFDGATIENHIAPDGAIWRNIGYTFSMRTLYDSRYVYEEDTFDKGYVGWQRMLGKPSLGLMGNMLWNRSLVYYPVGWIDAHWFVMSNYRYVYRFDQDLTNENNAKYTFNDLFDLQAT